MAWYTYQALIDTILGSVLMYQILRTVRLWETVKTVVGRHPRRCNNPEHAHPTREDSFSSNNSGVGVSAGIFTHLQQNRAGGRRRSVTRIGRLNIPKVNLKRSASSTSRSSPPR
ncbi:hypothetical protein HK102_009744, partial [Quaeritorhiza haematococci]